MELSSWSGKSRHYLNCRESKWIRADQPGDLAFFPFDQQDTFANGLAALPELPDYSQVRTSWIDTVIRD